MDIIGSETRTRNVDDRIQYARWVLRQKLHAARTPEQIAETEDEIARFEAAVAEHNALRATAEAAREAVAHVEAAADREIEARAAGTLTPEIEVATAVTRWTARARIRQMARDLDEADRRLARLRHEDARHRAAWRQRARLLAPGACPQRRVQPHARRVRRLARHAAARAPASADGPDPPGPLPAAHRRLRPPDRPLSSLTPAEVAP